VLYGMGFQTNFEGARSRYAASHSAQRAFKQIRGFAQQAVRDLPPHRTLIEQIYREGFRGKPSPTGVTNAGRHR
jgi:tryptophan halogenase